MGSGEFDPAAFDFQEVNAEIKEIKLS